MDKIYKRRESYILKFENVAICLGKGQNSKCFWLEFGTELITDNSLPQKASGREYIIRGIVDKLNKGHHNAHLATIRNVYYLKEK